MPEARQHPSFRELCARDSWMAARRKADEVYERFPNPDGNFVEQFQSTGFDQRVWELALFAGLEEICDSVDRVEDRPDFCCTAENVRFFVECTSAAPTQGPEGPPSPAESPDEFFDRLRARGDIADHEVAIKLGSALYSKLQKEYHKLDHVDGHPLILAIEAFFTEGSLWKSSSSVISFLYGLIPIQTAEGTYEFGPLEEHEHKGKSIPSGFLLAEQCRPISAIIFSNAGTISKFSRIGTQEGLGAPGVRLFRSGYRHNPDPEAVEPIGFTYEVGKIKERWCDGLTIMHNPLAAHPLSPRAFKNITHIHYHQGNLQIEHTDFDIFTSVTHNVRSAG